MLLKGMKFAQTRKTVLLLLKTKKLLYTGPDFQIEIIKIYSHLFRCDTCDYFLHIFSKSNFQSLLRPHRSDTPQFSSVSPDHVSVRGGGLITIHGEYFGRDPAYNNVGDTAGSGFKVKFKLKFQNIKSSQFKTLL